jgi:hypothetical protein
MSDFLNGPDLTQPPPLPAGITGFSPCGRAGVSLRAS